MDKDLGANSSGGEPELVRSLGPAQLILLGIGSIIGAGVYVMTGTAAANYAGPAVVVSFALGGVACAFTAFCYAELAGLMPVSGSAYSYTRAIFGHAAGWFMGWLLLLEYGVSAAGVAVGWAASINSLLADFGLAIDARLTTPLLFAATSNSASGLSVGNGLNLIAAVGVLMVALWLMRGVKSMARLNAIAVAIKVGVLLLFLAVGIWFIDPANWTPFVPAQDESGRYGLYGVLRGASALFFAYIGFEAVSTAAAETRNPERQVPIGLLGSLGVCTLIYCAVSATLTGIVPFRLLDTAAPLALAASAIGMGWFALLIKIGSVAGLTSVMLVLLYGQTRVLLAMARDGLAPAIFGRINPTSGVPAAGTLMLAVILAGIAASLPITLVGDLVSLGTATAFAAVCTSVIKLRVTRPDLDRPFRAPGGLVIPVLGIAASAGMAIPVVGDVVSKAAAGHPTSALIFTGYIGLGVAIFAVRRRPAGQVIRELE